MYTTEHFGFRLSITRAAPKRIKPCRRKLPIYPASIGEFTIGQLQQILNEIHRWPYKPTHIFGFNDETYIVRIIRSDSDGPPEDDPRADKWVG